MEKFQSGNLNVGNNNNLYASLPNMSLEQYYFKIYCIDTVRQLDKET